MVGDRNGVVPGSEEGISGKRTPHTDVSPSLSAVWIFRIDDVSVVFISLVVYVFVLAGGGWGECSCDGLMISMIGTRVFLILLRRSCCGGVVV